MPTLPKTSIKVIGVGNAWRGDDAAGLWVARRLKQENLPQVEISENQGMAGAIADAWQDALRVIVVDAMVAGGPSGAIYRFNAHDHDPAATFPVASSASSHGWGLSEALALGKVFQNLPTCLIIYGIAGENFTLGEGLSPTVAAAIPEAVRRITQEIQAWAERPPGKANQLPGNSPERQNNGT